MCMGEPALMNDVMSIARSGLQTSAAQFGAAASRVINDTSTASTWNAGVQQTNGTVQNSQAMNAKLPYNQNGVSGPPANGRVPSSNIAFNPAAMGNNLPRDIVSMKMASFAYRANMEGFATARKMFNVALDILA